MRASSLGGGGAIEGKMERELATTSQELKFRPQRSCGSPLSELSDVGQSAQTKKCNKHVKHVKEGQISRVIRYFSQILLQWSLT